MDSTCMISVPFQRIELFQQYTMYTHHAGAYMYNKMGGVSHLTSL